MGKIVGFFVGVPEAVDRRLVEGTAYELQPDGEAGSRRSARNGEAREAVHVRRPGQAG